MPLGFKPVPQTADAGPRTSGFGAPERVKESLAGDSTIPVGADVRPTAPPHEVRFEGDCPRRASKLSDFQDRCRSQPASPSRPTGIPCAIAELGVGPWVWKAHISPPRTKSSPADTIEAFNVVEMLSYSSSVTKTPVVYKR